MTQERRSAGKVGATVTFTIDTKIPMKKDLFLSNKSNKQNFVLLLSEFLKDKGCQTRHAGL